MRSTTRGQLLLLLFVCSGFSGLVYQSAWSHYLGLTLGHAAYAQSLVLAIFMGGMALGAWAASRHAQRLGDLLVAYAVLEAAIGVAGLLFHPLFTSYVAFTSDTLLPRLQSESVAHAWQWASATLLIAPQCVLLGATFPVLSAGYMRMAPTEAGPILGGLYFSNSLGAAIGALTTTFLLLPLIGMPGAMAAAGALNLFVAAGAWVIARNLRSSASEALPSGGDAGQITDRGVRTGRVLLIAAAITGGTSFVYEIGWVRMLNQALGTTVHAFELMLAAFILGLACGGLWVRRRTRRDVDPIALAGHAQWLMGAAALLSIPMFNQSFHWVGWLVQHLPRTEAGYVWFNAGSGLVAMLVMFPAAFFAGMTLPLFTLALLRSGSGEAGIGRVYAANTLGAIVGVFAMTHLLVPAIGIRLAVTLAALADIVLGLYLLRAISPARATRGYIAAAAAAGVALLASLQFGKPQPQMQAAGVFRTGNWTFDADIPFLRDGKTATITVAMSRDGEVANISTNGKPDASLTMRLDMKPSQDEVTMLMAGALPLALHPSPEHVAVIGWGSGLTTHTLLGSPVPKVVDTIEIEAAMHEGAKMFGPRVARAYLDPRSRVRIDDARTWFATGNRRYDVIVSEPSNPWVSGVASLFTEQFYGFAHSHLAPGGVLVQWVQSYELNDALLGTMVAALLEHFPNAELYLTNRTDLLIVAPRDAMPSPDWNRLHHVPLQGELARVGLASAADYELRKVGGPATLENFVRLSGAAPHSDYYPTVSLQAPRARFMRQNADSLLYLIRGDLPVQEILGERKTPPSVGVDAVMDRSLPGDARKLALLMRDALASGKVDPAMAELAPEEAKNAQRLLLISREPIRGRSAIEDWSRRFVEMSESIVGSLPAPDVAPLFEQPSWLADDQPAALRGLVAMEAALARRDTTALSLAAGRVLASAERDGLSNEAREHALVIAMLGAIADRRPQEVPVLEERYGASIPPSLLRGRLRAWLLAWADAPRMRALTSTELAHGPR